MTGETSAQVYSYNKKKGHFAMTFPEYLTEKTLINNQDSAPGLD